MLEAVAKNLWLLLTLVIPGLFTYGVWRAILLLEPSRRLSVEALAQVDSSALVTTSIIVAVAVLQQVFAIVVEAALSLLAKIMQQKWPNFHALFCERFVLAATGKLDENATRAIGNFFMSLNMCGGLALLLVYFLAYESLNLAYWVPISLIVFLAATIATAALRMINAKWVVEECKKKHFGKRFQGTA